ncbi:MAG: tRNA 2-thiouridine(34) synthase MnmA [Patescibacteria group bacterium]|nr:tRNA 2-thiouridine(34) synthase MnmA [Patescibacteria group bacterium]
MNKIKNKKVVVGMSGGVDSSVAAALIKKQGYSVIGVFLKFWQPPHAISCKISENSCCNMESLRKAREVAEILDIPFYVFDVSAKFKKEIVDYYIEEYKNGRTPNPCVKCNKLIKFGWLLDKARELGAEYVATGHYARLRREILNPKHKIINKSKISNNKFQTISLLNAKDAEKDQTYFLWQLSQEQLKHILFPIGDYKKSEIRKLAKKFKLPTAEKKDSQDVCFVPNNDNKKFLKYYLSHNKPGKIVNISGNMLGKHQGLYNFTIGQRHGLKNIQIKDKNNQFVPAYVIKIDSEKNQIVVGRKQDLYRQTLTASNTNWISPLYTLHLKPYTYFHCYAKIRYGSKLANVTVKLGKNKKIAIMFNIAQQAITPGQSVVFYYKNELIGGAIID